MPISQTRIPIGNASSAPKPKFSTSVPLILILGATINNAPKTSIKVPIDSLKKLFFKFLIAGPVQNVLFTVVSSFVRR